MRGNLVSKESRELPTFYEQARIHWKKCNNWGFLLIENAFMEIVEDTSERTDNLKSDFRVETLTFRPDDVWIISTVKNMANLWAQRIDWRQNIRVCEAFVSRVDRRRGRFSTAIEELCIVEIGIVDPRAWFFADSRGTRGVDDCDLARVSQSFCEEDVREAARSLALLSFHQISLELELPSLSTSLLSLE